MDSERIIDPETLDMYDVKYLFDDVMSKFDECLSAINFMATNVKAADPDKFPSVFKYLVKDCAYLVSDLCEARDNSSLVDDFTDFIAESIVAEESEEENED